MSHVHQDMGARFETRAGWEIVASYGDPGAESTAIDQAVGLADITPRGKVDLRGALEIPLRAAAGSTVARISDIWALVLTEPGGESAVIDRVDEQAGPAAMVTDVTHLYAGMAVAGPALPEVCARLTAWNPASLEPGAATGTSIGEVRAIVVRPSGDRPMLELYVASELGRYAWGTVGTAVTRLGGRPVGWEALQAGGWR